MTLTRRTSENSPGSPRPAQAPGARPGTTPRFIRRVTGLSGIAATAVAAVSGYLYFMFPGNPHRRWQPGRPGARAVRRDHRLRRLPRRAAALTAQLTIGGRLVQPIGPGGGEDVVAYRKSNDGLTRERVLTRASILQLRGRNGCPQAPR